MTKSKQTALVIAPGRGTYNKEELGYLSRYHADKADFIANIDTYRKEQGQTPVSELDNASDYVMKEHTRGDNASPLIYACAYADFLSIDRETYDIVAVTGNSMGWYIALACGGAVTPEGGMQIINTMGTFMQDALIGGQLIYTCFDENWQPIEGAHAALLDFVDEIEDLYTSIELGGMFVFGGTEEALKILEGRLEKRDVFPFRLFNHAAFHTPLQQPISEKALTHFKAGLFQNPAIPMVDGRGHIWTRFSSDLADMLDYTLGHQVVKPYDFTRAVQVGVQEFAPDKVIILGPGKTLGGAVAQSLLKIKWQGMETKEAFIARQKSDPFILSMGMEEQRGMVVG